MIYVAGFLGFIAGFFMGLALLMFLLNNVKKEDLLNDPYIKWKYGLINWCVAFLGAYAGVAIYERYFL
ncbi:MAG: hypothetical protein GC137_03595 [Alphaproteobacteria bacterium]|nr:hypothetical protein [Alphaproteobacteria bacterium]